MMESDFVDRLRAALDDAGITQSRLAQELDVRPATVSDWLTRKSIPGGEAMMRLPAILHVDGHWLLTGEGSPVREQGGETAVAGGERQRLATLLELALDIVEPGRRPEEAVRVTRVRKGRAGGTPEEAEESPRRRRRTM
jgi:HTH-type transcriptional regulator, cell division transcriptional repressor